MEGAPLGGVGRGDDGTDDSGDGVLLLERAAGERDQLLVLNAGGQQHGLHGVASTHGADDEELANTPRAK